MQLILSDNRGSEGQASGSPAARLRKLIARKRSEKERLEREIGRALTQLAELRALTRRVLDPLDDEVHDHFGFVLERGRFSAEVREEIEDLYNSLMSNGTISAGRRSTDARDIGECQCAFCTGERDGEPSRRDSADERVHVPPRPDGTPSRSLRDVYRELASRYHPDKAGDETTREENERLMREINGAYEAADLDALAALSQELGFVIAGDGILEALAAQYERIKAEVRALRHGGPGELVVETRACEKRGATPPLVALAAHIHGDVDQLEGLASLFRSFRAGDTTGQEFLDVLLGEEDNDDELVESLGIIASMAAETRTTPSRSTRDRAARKRKRKMQRRARSKTRR